MKKSLFARLMALALALVMVFSLVGCAAKEEEPAEPSTESTEAEKPGATEKTEEPKAEEESEETLGILDPYPETVTVSISRLLDHVSTYPEGVTNDKNGYIDYTLEKLNIQCVTAWEANSGEDYDRQTSLAVASGEIPDFLYIYGDGSGSGLTLVKELYESGYIMSIDEVYEQYASDRMKDAYASYGDSIWNGIVFDGERYAIPYAAGLYYPMIWVRSDWMQELDITIDEDGDGIITRDELAAVAKAFVDADMSGTGNTVGLAFPDNLAVNGLHTLTDSFGAFMINYMPNEDGTVSHGSTDPAMKEALSWLADLYADGILDPQYGTRNQEDIEELLTNGQLGIFTDGWYFGTARKSIHEMDPEADWVSYNLDNGSGKVNFPATLVSKDQFFVISSECEHPEAIFKMWELEQHYSSDLTVEEQRAEHAVLREQKDAGMGGQARPVYIDILAAQFAYDKQINPVLSYLKDGTIIGTFDPATNSFMRSYNTYFEDRTTMDSADWVLYLSRFAGGAYHAWKLSQADLYEMYNPIYNQVPSMTSNPTDFQGMMEEYFIKIITGELPVDAFDEYVEQRNAQGDAAICAELAEAIK